MTSNEPNSKPTTSESSSRMCVIGITGTNGKTTTSFLIDAILRKSNKKTGLIGTIENRIDSDRFPTRYTTPPANELENLLSQMLKHNVTHVVSEISSHALAEKRVDAVMFDIGVFLNFSPEHLRFHKTMDAYLKAKTRLFSELLPHSSKKDRFAVICLDEPTAKDISEAIPDGVRQITFSTQPTRGCDSVATHVESSTCGLTIRASVLGREMVIRSPLIGRHNTQNILAAVTVAKCLNISDSDILEAIGTAQGPPGRLERVHGGRPLILVDYAHTPVALKASFAAVREQASMAGGKIICVFGCGGERDRGKRPQFGAIVTKRADLTILTTDNPRSEDPRRILSDILAGAKRNRNIIIEPKRPKAIATAFALARDDDVILLSGKGHECSQEFHRKATFFSDRLAAQREILLRYLGGKTITPYCQPVPDCDGLLHLAKLLDCRLPANVAGRKFGALGMEFSRWSMPTVAILSPLSRFSEAAQFVRRVAGQGAVAAIVPWQLARWHELFAPELSGFPLLVVQDSLEAIIRIEKWLGKSLWNVQRVLNTTGDDVRWEVI